MSLAKINLKILVFCLSIVVFFSCNLFNPPKPLKIYLPSDVNPKLVDSSVIEEKNHRISDFKLLSQMGDTITLKDVDNKIYVADFFFTTCAKICPKMTAQMKSLHDFYIDDEDIFLVSHTVYPEIDSVEVLRSYAQQYEVNPDKWVMLTGDKKEIYALARKSYFAVLTEGDGGERDFVHTENFVLIDKLQRIRGYYDGTLKNEMKRLKSDIEVLRREYR